MAGFQQGRIARVQADGQSKKLIEGIKEIYSGDAPGGPFLFRVLIVQNIPCLSRHLQSLAIAMQG